MVMLKDFLIWTIVVKSGIEFDTITVEYGINQNRKKGLGNVF